MLRLYTFQISHFSEKARWALDIEGIPYVEQVLVPGPHQFVTRRIAKQSTVPLLVHDGHVVQGSSAIVDYIGERLGGRRLSPKNAQELADARALETELDVAFGLGIQRVLYGAALDDRAMLTELWSAGGPFWARAFFAVAFPAVAAVVKRMYQTHDPQLVAASKVRFVEQFDKVDAVISKQPYLGGDHPTRIDIAVAALLAPLCKPPEHRVKWPEAPVILRDFEAQLRGRPTWNHVLRMYREHRLTTGPTDTASRCT
jgi:glutathione S-transferase